MIGTFRKISRVRNLAGGIRWYLSDDCLLAAKQTMYTVEYRRFYLRDLEWIMVWPSPSWRLRMIVPAALLAVISAALWGWVNSTASEIFAGVGVAWVAIELLLGPTATSRVRTTGVSVDLPIVKRTRRASKVLAAIDAAVRASRDVAAQPISIPPNSETATSITSTESVPQANGF